jgi:putative tricarboxylic transport membrane protein
MTPSNEVRSGGLRLRSPQNLVSGLILVAASAFVVWMLSGLSQGTMRTMGPAMLPRWSAIAIGIGGFVLIGLSMVREGDALERWHLRGPLVIIAALVFFAGTIRQPGFLVAAPLTMLVAGFGSREVRPRELIVFAVVMTLACALLFRFALNQPLPMLVIPALSLNL